MNIEERLDRLEKQNRNLRRGLVGLLLLVVVVPLAAFVWQDKKFNLTKRLHVKELNFVDGNGDAVGKIAGSKKGVLLQFGGKVGGRETGLPMLALKVDSLGPRIEVRDADDNIRAVLGSTTAKDAKWGAETKYPESTLTLYDVKGKVLHQVPK